jgi:hypothetical protein
MSDRVDLGGTPGSTAPAQTERFVAGQIEKWRTVSSRRRFRSNSARERTSREQIAMFSLRLLSVLALPALAAACVGLPEQGVVADGAKWEEVSRAGRLFGEGVVAAKDGRPTSATSRSARS